MLNIGVNVAVVSLEEYNKMQKEIRDLKKRIKLYEDAVQIPERGTRGPELQISVKPFQAVVASRLEKSIYGQTHTIVDYDSVCWNTYMFDEKEVQADEDTKTDNE